MSPTLPDRARGLLVGLALGDGLGAPFEGDPRPDPRRVTDWLAAGNGIAADEAVPAAVALWLRHRGDHTAVVRAANEAAQGARAW